MWVFCGCYEHRVLQNLCTCDSTWSASILLVPRIRCTKPSTASGAESSRKFFIQRRDTTAGFQTPRTVRYVNFGLLVTGENHISLFLPPTVFRFISRVNRMQNPWLYLNPAVQVIHVPPTDSGVRTWHHTFACIFLACIFPLAKNR